MSIDNICISEIKNDLKVIIGMVENMPTSNVPKEVISNTQILLSGESDKVFMEGLFLAVNTSNFSDIINANIISQITGEVDMFTVKLIIGSVYKLLHDIGFINVAASFRSYVDNEIDVMKVLEIAKTAQGILINVAGSINRSLVRVGVKPMF